MDLPLPVVDVTVGVLSFVIVALSMIGVTIFVLLQILPRRAEAPLQTQIVLAFAVISGGSLLLVSLLFVFIDTNGTTAWTMVLLAFNFMMMFPAGFWFVSHILFEDRRISPTSWAWPLVLGVSVTGSEVVMGVLFAYAGLGHALSLTASLADGLSSIWFYWSMAAVMVGLLLWVPLSPLERWGSAALTATAALAPWITAYPLVGGAAGTAVMTAVFLVVARRLFAHRAAPVEVGFLLGLTAWFLAMAVAAAGLVVARGAPVAPIAFGTVMAVGMVGEIGYLARRSFVGAASREWGPATIARDAPAAPANRALDPVPPDAAAPVE
ncbi:MAG TPA: hypothetical protein VMG36_08340 [Thermoplasmata archaeon]|nr:hypothetical protein [Thermoplasmata archaeon]